ncbi:probable ATP-dependent RNA helicase ddx52 isoform X2 [Daktulosphaira vitifoliae]|uniref:probable ATP-dependent RNA helicase ddx52 isoform X2 n=1 Tax=Daktulosphaira vitifoliae TaxID=58002 RepID=UPI0021AABC4F|nr:probable ATP-dependent RNA helicase ddx52 isoform X2 [Daktulosphaira vitifoliae]
MDHLSQLQKEIMELNSENKNLQEKVAVLKDCLSLEKVKQKIYELEKKEKILVLLESKVEKMKLDIKPLKYLRTILYQQQNHLMKDDLKKKQSIETITGSLNENSTSDLLSDVDSESSIRVLSEYDIISDEEIIKNYNDKNPSKILYCDTLDQASLKYSELSIIPNPSLVELTKINDRLEKTNTWVQNNYNDSIMSDIDCSFLALPLLNSNHNDKYYQEINEKTGKLLSCNSYTKSTHSILTNNSRLSMDNISLNTEDILVKNMPYDEQSLVLDISTKNKKISVIDKNVADLEFTTRNDKEQNNSNSSSTYNSWLEINDEFISNENIDIVVVNKIKHNNIEIEELNEGTINDIQYSIDSEKENDTITNKIKLTDIERNEQGSNGVLNSVIETSNSENNSKLSNSTHNLLKFVNNLQIESNERKKLDAFNKINLKRELLHGIYSNGFNDPLLLQQFCLNQCISGCDAILHSYPCTGKTIMCLISVLQRIDTLMKECQGIILVPTKQLALSTQKMVKSLGRFLKVFTCIGSKNVPRKVAPVPHVIIIVVDDVDDMINDISFCKQMKQILLFLHNDRQLILSSSSKLEAMLDIFSDCMKDPVHMILPDIKPSLGDVIQYYFYVQEEWKFEALDKLIEALNLNNIIVYCNTWDKTLWLAENLRIKACTVSTVNNDMELNQRQLILKRFHSGSTRLLITNNLLKDDKFKNVEWLINYDLPRNAKKYVRMIIGHFSQRIKVINFITENDTDNKINIETTLKTMMLEIPLSISNLLESFKSKLH